MRREHGASVLQYVGVVSLAAALVAGVFVVASEGRAVTMAQYAFCALTGGECTDHRIPPGLPGESTCAVPPTGPPGATRITSGIDFGAIFGG